MSPASQLVFPAGHPADGHRLQQSHFYRTGLPGDMNKRRDSVALDQFRRRHGHDVGVEAGFPGRRDRFHGDAKGAAPAAIAVVFLLVTAVEADRYRENTALSEPTRPRRGQTVSGRIQGQAGPIVEGSGNIFQVVPQERLATGQGDRARSAVQEFSRQLAKHVQGHVLLASSGVGTAPAGVGAPVGHGQAHGEQAAPVRRVLREAEGLPGFHALLAKVRYKAQHAQDEGVYQSVPHGGMKRETATIDTTADASNTLSRSGVKGNRTR